MGKPRTTPAKSAKDSVFVTVCRQVFQARAVAGIALLSLVITAVAFQHSAAGRRNTQLEQAIQTDREQIAVMEQQLPQTNVTPEVTASNPAESTPQSEDNGNVQAVTDGSSDQETSSSRATKRATPKTVGSNTACTHATKQAQESRRQALSLENIYHESQLAEIRKLPLIGSLTELLVRETERHLSKVRQIEQTYLQALRQLPCN